MCFAAFFYSRLFNVNSSLALIVLRSRRTLLRLLFELIPLQDVGFSLSSQKFLHNTWHVNAAKTIPKMHPAITSFVWCRWSVIRLILQRQIQTIRRHCKKGMKNIDWSLGIRHWRYHIRKTEAYTDMHAWPVQERTNIWAFKQQKSDLLAHHLENFLSYLVARISWRFCWCIRSHSRSLCKSSDEKLFPSCDRSVCSPNCTVSCRRATCVKEMWSVLSYQHFWYIHHKQHEHQIDSVFLKPTQSFPPTDDKSLFEHAVALGKLFDEYKFRDPHLIRNGKKRNQS